VDMTGNMVYSASTKTARPSQTVMDKDMCGTFSQGRHSASEVLQQQSLPLGGRMQIHPSTTSGSYGVSLSGIPIVSGGSSMSNSGRVPKTPGQMQMNRQRDTQQGTGSSRALGGSYGGVSSMGHVRGNSQMMSSSATQDRRQSQGGRYGYYMSPGGHNHTATSIGNSSPLVSGSYTQGAVIVTSDFGQALFRPEINERRHLQSQQQQHQLLLHQHVNNSLPWSAGSSPQAWQQQQQQQQQQQPVMMSRQTTTMEPRSYEKNMMTSMSMGAVPGRMTGWTGQSSQQSGMSNSTGNTMGNTGGYEYDPRRSNTGTKMGSAAYGTDYQIRTHRVQDQYNMARSDPYSHTGLHVNAMSPSYAMSNSPYGHISNTSAVYHVPGGGVGIVPVTSAQTSLSSSGDLRGVMRRLDNSFDGGNMSNSQTMNQTGNVQFYSVSAPAHESVPDSAHSEEMVSMADADPFFPTDEDTDEWGGDIESEMKSYDTRVDNRGNTGKMTGRDISNRNSSVMASGSTSNDGRKRGAYGTSGSGSGGQGSNMRYAPSSSRPYDGYR